MPLTESELLEIKEKLIKAIEDRVDWFIARINEKDKHRWELYDWIYRQKSKKLKEVIEKAYERLNG